MPKLWEYKLTADILCIGERFKKGLIRPCVKTIPYSTITGALRQEVLGVPSWDDKGYAFGCLDKYEEIMLVGGPRDAVTDVSKLPLTTQALADVKGRVYIVCDEDTKDLPHRLEFSMGALKSKGFGRVSLIRERNEPIDGGKTCIGYLNTRIPEELLGVFGITRVIKPVYGYLFKPTSGTGGVWVRAMFDSSIVESSLLVIQGGCNEAR